MQKNDNDLLNKAEHRKAILISLFYFAAILAAVIIVCRFAFDKLVPFIIAFIVAAILRIPLKAIDRKNGGARHKLWGVVLVAVFYLTIGALAALIAFRLFQAIKDFIVNLPTYWTDTLQPGITGFLTRVEELFSKLKFENEISITDVLSNVTNAVSSFSSTIVSKMSSMAVSIPTLLIRIVFCVASTAFMLIDWDKLVNFLHRQVSSRTSTLVEASWKALKKVLWGYVKSYGLILLMTFSELTFGLWIIGVQDFGLIALLIAIFDILPVVGCGAILAPWGIIALVQGNIRIGIGVLILYGIILVVRNIVEPKVVGKHVGLHPVVTLMSMIIGTAVFGAPGLFGLPIAMAVITTLDREGTIHLFNNEDNIAEKANTSVDLEEK